MLGVDATALTVPAMLRGLALPNKPLEGSLKHPALNTTLLPDPSSECVSTGLCKETTCKVAHSLFPVCTGLCAQVSKGDRILMMNTGKEHIVDEIGVLAPNKVTCWHPQGYSKQCQGKVALLRDLAAGCFWLVC
eukprot:632684-Pelagomonas_calceolata.AAC.4